MMLLRSDPGRSTPEAVLRRALILVAHRLVAAKLGEPARVNTRLTTPGAVRIGERIRDPLAGRGDVLGEMAIKQES
jgi:hypothetical protein